MSMRTSDVAAALRNHALSAMNRQRIVDEATQAHLRGSIQRRMVGDRRHGHAHLHIGNAQHLFLEAGFKHLIERLAEINPPAAQQHGVDVDQIHCRADGRGQRVDGAIRPPPRSALSPVCQASSILLQSLGPLDASFAADHTGGLHQRAPAGVCLQGTRLRPHLHSGPSKGNRHVTDFAGETHGEPATTSPSRTMAPPMPISQDR